jgi:xanthine dehydrogenase YagS FAD-binding subunit
MKNFIYKQPKNLRDAGQVFKKMPEAVPYGGGTDLLGLIKDGTVSPDQLVDLKHIPGMSKIKYSAGKGLTIGALVKVAEVADHPVIKKKYPALAQAAQAVASPQLRNMGTIAGNLCQRPRCWYFRGHFDCIRKGGDTCFAVEGENKFHCIIGGGPCFIVHPSDTAVALLALDASLSIFLNNKRRKLALKDFFVLPDKDAMHENVLQPGELITEILVPDVKSDTHSAFIKASEREVWDFATVSAAVVWQGSKSRVESGKVVLGGVAPVPWHEQEVSRGLSGIALNETSVEQLAAKALKNAEPMTQNSYKVQLARNLIKRLLQDAS